MLSVYFGSVKDLISQNRKTRKTETQGWHYTECLNVPQKNNGQTNETAGQLLSVRNLFIAATTCMWHWPSLLRRGSLWGIFTIGRARGEWWEEGKGGSSFPFPSFPARYRFSLSAKKPLRSKQHERGLCGGERHWPICKTLDLSFLSAFSCYGWSVGQLIT